MKVMLQPYEVRTTLWISLGRNKSVYNCNKYQSEERTGWTKTQHNTSDYKNKKHFRVVAPTEFT